MIGLDRKCVRVCAYGPVRACVCVCACARECVRHLREEGGDGDALALVDVVEAGTEALHDGG